MGIARSRGSTRYAGRFLSLPTDAVGPRNPSCKRCRSEKDLANRQCRHLEHHENAFSARIPKVVTTLVADAVGYCLTLNSSFPPTGFGTRPTDPRRYLPDGPLRSRRSVEFRTASCC